MAKKLANSLFTIVVLLILFAVAYWVAIDLMADNDALIARFAILGAGMTPTLLYIQHLYDNYRWAKPLGRKGMK